MIVVSGDETLEDTKGNGAWPELDTQMKDARERKGVYPCPRVGVGVCRCA